MATKKTSKNQQAAYSTYKTTQRWLVNRTRKLTKLLKQHPDNLQIAQALKNISYRRKTPKSQMWQSSTKASAQLIKYFCGSCDIGVFNASREVVTASYKAMNVKSREKFAATNQRTSNTPIDFSIAARI